MTALLSDGLTVVNELMPTDEGTYVIIIAVLDSNGDYEGSYQYTFSIVAAGSGDDSEDDPDDTTVTDDSSGSDNTLFFGIAAAVIVAGLIIGVLYIHEARKI
jgi:hypothetical protein